MCLLDPIDSERNVWGGGGLKVILTSSNETRQVRKVFKEPETLLHMAALGGGRGNGFARFEEKMGF